MGMEATAVRNLSRAERSKQLTANSASARIPSTKSKAAMPHARVQSTLAMATATTITTTVPADSIKVTAAVKMSKKPTTRSANARTRTTRKIKTVKENAVSRSTRATATATTRTTTVARIRWRRLLCEICQGRKGPNSLLQTVPVQGSQAQSQRLQCHMQDSKVHWRWQLRRR